MGRRNRGNRFSGVGNRRYLNHFKEIQKRIGWKPIENDQQRESLLGRDVVDLYHKNKKEMYSWMRENQEVKTPEEVFPRFSLLLEIDPTHQMSVTLDGKDVVVGVGEYVWTLTESLKRVCNLVLDVTHEVVWNHLKTYEWTEMCKKRGDHPLSLPILGDSLGEYHVLYHSYTEDPSVTGILLEDDSVLSDEDLKRVIGEFHQKWMEVQDPILRDLVKIPPKGRELYMEMSSLQVTVMRF
jgi:hypothetical protein